ncbi:hypothetical protein M501DRAFT_942109 [Patellaria atrata CBS 101060]|uniref:DUF1275 domain protein n=1 Tax=Patellaria atrata CBS 101060 TaxID=1346257 RepID=A0A9P4VPG2_9PEZI|nr:hypothetical protein M501DRAFT_942109 [Patellaria atrata CBS 101060]
MVARSTNILRREYFFHPINPQHGDIALLICCFVTGMLDAASYVNFSAFVGMQTGNTIILGISAASLPVTQSIAYATTLVSIGSFLTGAGLSAVFARRFSKPTRATILTLFLIQTLLIILAATLCSTSLVPQDPKGDGSTLHDIRILTPISPLAFQSGMQIQTSRVLGFNELPTTVLTSSYADLIGDPNIFKLNNRKRDRRVGASILVLLGGISSAWLLRAGIGIDGVLWIGAGLKGLITVGVLVVMRNEPRESIKPSENP